MTKLLDGPTLTPADIDNCNKALVETVHDRFGENVAFVAVMNGALYFAADFTRVWQFKYDTNPFVGSIRCVSYDGQNQRATRLHGTQDLNSLLLEQKDVVLLDTVVDTGHTLGHLMTTFPNVIGAAALITKPDKLQVEAKEPVLFAASVEGDPWLVGYGLDYDGGRYRSMRGIYRIERDPVDLETAPGVL